MPEARAQQVKWCFIVCEVEQAPVIDSFCKAYQRVNRSGPDAAEIRRLPRDIKSRVDANDVLYLCRCEGWDNPICK